MERQQCVWLRRVCLRLDRPGGGPSFITSAWVTLGKFSNLWKLSFLICAMGIMIVPTSVDCWKDLMRWFLVQCLVLNKCLLNVSYDSYWVSLFCEHQVPFNIPSPWSVPACCKQMYWGNNNMGKLEEDSLRCMQPESREGSHNFSFCYSSGVILGPGEVVMNRAAQAPAPWTWHSNMWLTLVCLSSNQPLLIILWTWENRSS